ncbi:UDP-N-acetylglucosamine 2-epimerase (non-hydrolyzing) [Flavobacteriaceae bacterium F89]|uniref:UDP-N-acetylglucosamine 2-epimerase (Non-hydrolyzing) n=1 Tax=Cerina litoralis TaxID=2874477 RepID=A0AAE3EVH4_9FLAO|nr:UDP-N-acetylglucosamine 2-epimerase (non-hydrolyzing) [Cerina litoralis]MCG2460959.1 UDP-N-acetylglucosamine 2-epimerase (non-hydrolyzing) [Cerina litoralis]
MKIITIVGARPQFVKAAVVSRAIEKYNEESTGESIQELIVHTGQHFDENMSSIFFDQMGIPKPHYNLEINSLTHGAMTGKMLEKIEAVLLKEKPDWVLVYGDTNSTIAGALAAKKLHIKVAHVEAGLRSFNMEMPEEINRILTDRISDILFCPTQTAIDNLEKEGYANIKSDRIQCGDVMYDAVLFYADRASRPKGIEQTVDFVLSTIHRQENTDDPAKLTSIFDALGEIAEKQRVVLPLHPRTVKKLKEFNIVPAKNIQILDPVGYFEMIWLLSHCQMAITDSGGLQKEAFFFKKPCITVRDETEWVELVQNGSNYLTGHSKDLIIKAFNIIREKEIDFSKALYGKGDAGQIIVEELIKYSSIDLLKPKLGIIE